MTTISLPQYDVTLGPLGEFHRAWLNERRYAGLVVLVDENTYRHCWPRLEPWLLGLGPVVIKIPPGELYKNLDTCRDIWTRLFDASAGRRWCLLNLGGGVIGDMGGFCAGTYKRGIDFVQIPTTLLSQVDASVGGKLGIDFNGIKNSIGLFQDPAAVWIDPAFLTTLSPRELRSGFAEVIKHALIADARQWEVIARLDDLSKVDWSDFLADSVRIKQRIVLADPHERGPRKALNFGHTIGHAVESYWLDTLHPLLHGEAIAIGMICEAWLSHHQQGLGKEALDVITQFLLRHYGHHPIPADSLPRLLAYMRQDKKNEGDAINVSLLPAVGQVAVNQTAEPQAIADSIAYYNRLANAEW